MKFKSRKFTALYLIPIVVLSTVFFVLLPQISTFVYFELQVDRNNVSTGEEITFNLLNKTGIHKMIWDFHDSSAFENTSSEIDSLKHTFLFSGQFLVSVIALNAYNYSFVQTVPIVVSPTIPDFNVIIDNDTFLENELITFSTDLNPTEDKITDLLWEFGDGTTAFGKTVEHAYNNQGNYSIKTIATTTDDLEITNYSFINIINQVPFANFRASNKNTGVFQNIEFNASDTIDSSFDQTSLFYSWDFGDNQVGSGFTINHSYSKSGKYNVTLFVIDNNGAINKSSQEILITVPKNFQVEIATSSDTPYEGETSFFSIINNQPFPINYQYTWSTGSNGTVFPYRVYNENPYTAQVNVTDFNQQNISILLNKTISPVNVAPIISFLDASSKYNVTIKVWGTVGTNFTYYLFENEMLGLNGSLSSIQTNYPSTGLTLTNLNQPLFDFWDILTNVSAFSGSFNNTVEFAFQQDNGVDLKIQQVFNDTIQDWRFPLNPIERNFTIDFDFQVFDPGNDSIKTYVNVTTFKTILVDPNSRGYTSDIVTVSDIYPVDQNVTFYATNIYENESSSINQIILQNITSVLSNSQFASNQNWERWGNIMKKPEGSTSFNSIEASEGDTISFIIDSHKDLYNITWFFGDGEYSNEQNPSHVYKRAGPYLAWVKTYDGFYNQVFNFDVLVNLVNISELFNPAGITIDIHTGDTLFLKSSDLGFSDSNLHNWQYYWAVNNSQVGIGNNFQYTFHEESLYTINVIILQYTGEKAIFNLSVNVTDTGPVLLTPLTNFDSNEGLTTILYANITHNPIEYLSLDYNWLIEGKNYNEWMPSLILKPGTYKGQLLVTDGNNKNITIDFIFKIRLKSPELRISKYILYGQNSLITMLGSISKTIFDKDVNYTLKYEFNDIEYTIENVQEIFNFNITIPNFFSRFYLITAFLFLDDTVVSTFSRAIKITIDYDGDFYSDQQEMVMETNISDKKLTKDLTENLLQKIFSDSDSDGLNDFEENRFFLNPELSDYDGDGLLDAQEVNGYLVTYFKVFNQTISYYVTSDPRITDIDDDNSTDFEEYMFGTDPNKKDTDKDGLDDYLESQLNTDPLNQDTDFDGLLDGIEILGYTVQFIDIENKTINKFCISNPFAEDTDSDNIKDLTEYQWGLCTTTKDTDSDGLTDFNEINLFKTNPNNVDTDNDKLKDGFEANGWNMTLFAGTVYITNKTGQEIVHSYAKNLDVFVSSNPLSNDTDGDGFSDYDEIYGSNETISRPDALDSDLDGFNDIYDTMRLMTEYEAPGFDSPISVKYKPQFLSDSVTKYFTLDALLSSAWNSIKTDSLLWTLLDIYVSKADKGWSWNCFCYVWDNNAGVNAVKSKISSLLKTEIKNNPTAYNNLLTSYNGFSAETISFKDFGINFKYNGLTQLPTITVTGKWLITAFNFVGQVTGLTGFSIYVDFIASDNAGIQNISLKLDSLDFNDNILTTTSKSYFGNGKSFLDVSFSQGVTKSGNSPINQLSGVSSLLVNSQRLTIKLTDINGNIREIVLLLESQSISVNDLVADIGYSVLNFFNIVDEFNWTINEIKTIFQETVTVIEEYYQEVSDFVSKIINYLRDGTAIYWENLIRYMLVGLDAVGFTEGRNYMIEGLETIQIHKSQVKQSSMDFLNTSALNEGLDFLDQGFDNLKNSIPDFGLPPDAQEVMRNISNFLSPIYDKLGLVGYIFQELEERAIEILSRVYQEFINEMMKTALAKFVKNIQALAEQFLFVIMDGNELLFSLIENFTNLDLSPFLDNLDDPNFILNKLLDLLPNPSTVFNTVITWLRDYKLSGLIDFLFSGNPSNSFSVLGLFANFMAPFIGVAKKLSSIFDMDISQLGILPASMKITSVGPNPYFYKNSKIQSSNIQLVELIFNHLANTAFDVLYNVFYYYQSYAGLLGSSIEYKLLVFKLAVKVIQGAFRVFGVINFDECDPVVQDLSYSDLFIMFLARPISRILSKVVAMVYVLFAGEWDKTLVAFLSLFLKAISTIILDIIIGSIYNRYSKTMRAVLGYINMGFDIYILILDVIQDILSSTKFVKGYPVVIIGRKIQIGFSVIENLLYLSYTLACRFRVI
jgi:chitodextrinase